MLHVGQRSTRLVWIWLGCVLAIPAATTANAQPLFDDEVPLELVVDGPLGRILNDRVGESTYRDGTVRYVDASGAEVVLPVEIRTRGKTRRKRDVCAFPPLRFRFDHGDTPGTVFEGQRAIKLVTHCKDNQGYDQLVLQEYMAYRIYNVLTDYSHRVRLANITYRQSGGVVVAKRLAFFLERWEKVAERNDVIAAEVDGGVNVDSLSRADTNRVALFQYLIGNEDYSLRWPESNENCCHNSKPLFTDGVVIPLPYDFDFSGIVDAPYAVPKSPNRDVRNRRYHGLCSTMDESFTEVLELFREQRQEIYALYEEQDILRDRARGSTLGYLDSFYEVIDDPAKLERQVVKRCRKQ